VLEVLPPSPRVSREDLLRVRFDFAADAAFTPLYTYPTARSSYARYDVQLSLDEVLEGRPGLEAVGVTPTPLKNVSIAFLRRYRSANYYDAPADADSPEALAALRAAAEGEQAPTRPVA